MIREEKKENIYISSIIQLLKKSMTYICKLSELSIWGYPPPPQRGKATEYGEEVGQKSTHPL